MPMTAVMRSVIARDLTLAWRRRTCVPLALHGVTIPAHANVLIYNAYPLPTRNAAVTLEYSYR